MGKNRYVKTVEELYKEIEEGDYGDIIYMTAEVAKIFSDPEDMYEEYHSRRKVKHEEEFYYPYNYGDILVEISIKQGYKSPHT